MPALHSRKSELILFNWKSHQIVSWKPRIQRQTAARGSWFRADCVPAQTHDDAALTHAHTHSNETKRAISVLGKHIETHTHATTNDTDTESLQNDKWARSRHLGFFHHLYVNESIAILPSRPPSLLSRNQKDRANLRSHQTRCQRRRLRTAGSQMICDRTGHDEVKWAKMTGFYREQTLAGTKVCVAHH